MLVTNTFKLISFVFLIFKINFYLKMQYFCFNLVQKHNECFVTTVGIDVLMLQLRLSVATLLRVVLLCFVLLWLHLQSWRLWVKLSHAKLQRNTTTRKFCVWFLRCAKSKNMSIWPYSSRTRTLQLRLWLKSWIIIVQIVISIRFNRFP